MYSSKMCETSHPDFILINKPNHTSSALSLSPALKIYKNGIRLSCGRTLTQTTSLAHKSHVTSWKSSALTPTRKLFLCSAMAFSSLRSFSLSRVPQGILPIIYPHCVVIRRLSKSYNRWQSQPPIWTKVFNGTHCSRDSSYNCSRSFIDLFTHDSTVDLTHHWHCSPAYSPSVMPAFSLFSRLNFFTSLCSLMAAATAMSVMCSSRPSPREFFYSSFVSRNQITVNAWVTVAVDIVVAVICHLIWFLSDVT